MINRLIEIARLIQFLSYLLQMDLLSGTTVIPWVSGRSPPPHE